MIAHFLGWLFPEMEIIEQAAFRVTRDGDTEISDDADDLLEAVESELQKRRFGAVVRLEVSQLDLPRDARPARGAPACQSRHSSIRSRGCSTSPTSASCATLDRPDLKYVPWVPYTQRRLAAPNDGDLFAEIAHRDIVVQHPYDSFATSVEAFVRAAAKDPSVGHAEDDRLPHEPRLGARAGADRRPSRTASRACASSS